MLSEILSDLMSVDKDENYSSRDISEHRAVEIIEGLRRRGYNARYISDYPRGYILIQGDDVVEITKEEIIAFYKKHTGKTAKIVRYVTEHNPYGAE